MIALFFGVPFKKFKNCYGGGLIGSDEKPDLLPVICPIIQTLCDIKCFPT